MSFVGLAGGRAAEKVSRIAEAGGGWTKWARTTAADAHLSGRRAPPGPGHLISLIPRAPLLVILEMDDK